jgi:hypothetical protein
MSDLAEYITGLVREQLKRMPAFAGATRDTFDNYVLADLEDAIRREINGIECAAYEEGYSDAEVDFETKAAARREEAAARKAKKTKESAA